MPTNRPTKPSTGRGVTLRLILGRFHAARQPKDMSLPGLRLHDKLKGKRSRTWAVDVSENWRITFRFDGENVDRSTG
jgi:proteic killer suppression protein